MPKAEKALFCLEFQTQLGKFTTECQKFLPEKCMLMNIYLNSPSPFSYISFEIDVFI
jgi:hypothetical protein